MIMSNTFTQPQPWTRSKSHPDKPIPRAEPLRVDPSAPSDRNGVGYVTQGMPAPNGLADSPAGCFYRPWTCSRGGRPTALPAHTHTHGR